MNVILWAWTLQIFKIVNLCEVKLETQKLKKLETF